MKLTRISQVTHTWIPSAHKPQSAQTCSNDESNIWWRWLCILHVIY